MDWLYLKGRKTYLNMDRIGAIYYSDDYGSDKLYLCLKGENVDIVISGDDAAKVIEYLERVAYA